MFWFLHRLIKTLIALGFVGVAVFIYLHRVHLEPAWNLAELWWNRPSRLPAQLPGLTGTVTRVYSGDGLQLRDDQGALYNYGLAGVGAPKATPDANAATRRQAEQSREYLHTLAQGSQVELLVTLANPQNRTGLGLARAAGTNLNETVLRAGQGRLNRDQIRVLPLREQFRLTQAERLARRSSAGLWAPSSPPAPSPPTAAPTN